jgi:hypothetical protein
MALEGTLKDFALPDIFQLIGLQKKTGVLILNDNTDEVTIAFKDGMLVSADSKKKRLEERLGTRLTRSGLITEGQLHDSLEKQKQTFQRLGVILVNEQLVKAEDLRRALEIQVTQIVYRVFRWEDAEYRFDQDAQIDYDKEFFRPIGAESLLMEGMRIIDEWPIVEKAVRSMQTVYERVQVNQPIEIEKDEEEDSDDDDDFDFDLGKTSPKEDRPDAIKLSPQEGAVWNLLDGKRTVEDLMYLARLSDFDTAKAIYDLMNRDLIREKTGSGSGGGARSMAALAAEASPMVVWGLTALVFLLAVAGAVMFPHNRLNQGQILGLVPADVERQDQAVLTTRMDRVVHSLEAYRLANGDQAYPEDIEELIDLKFLREVDIHLPYGVHFEYTRLDGGEGYRLQAVDSDNQEIPELERTGGQSATEAGQ